MCSASAANQLSGLWGAALQGLVAVTFMAVYQGFQYLRERQLHRAVQDIARLVKPGIVVDFTNRHSSLRIRRDPAAPAPGSRKPLPDGEPSFNVVPLPHPLQGEDA